MSASPCHKTSIHCHRKQTRMILDLPIKSDMEVIPKASALHLEWISYSCGTRKCFIFIGETINSHQVKAVKAVNFLTSACINLPQSLTANQFSTGVVVSSSSLSRCTNSSGVTTPPIHILASAMNSVPSFSHLLYWQITKD